MQIKLTAWLDNRRIEPSELELKLADETTLIWRILVGEDLIAGIPTLHIGFRQVTSGHSYKLHYAYEYSPSPETAAQAIVVQVRGHVSLPPPVWWVAMPPIPYKVASCMHASFWGACVQGALNQFHDGNYRAKRELQGLSVRLERSTPTWA